METPAFVSRVFEFEFQPMNFHIISRVFNGNFNGSMSMLLQHTSQDQLSFMALPFREVIMFKVSAYADDLVMFCRDKSDLEV